MPKQTARSQSIHLRVILITLFFSSIAFSILNHIRTNQLNNIQDQDTADAAGGRSTLYPENWQPGYKDAKGRFLHDFSYAGYQMGEKPIPNNSNARVYDVTKYGADSTGKTNSSTQIQNAINDAQNNGGGVVYLPAGTYLLKFQSGKSAALSISKNNVVLRGAGADATKLFLDETYVRNKRVIEVHANNSWETVSSNNTSITRDLLEPTHTIPVSSTSGYNVGDWIVVRADTTTDFKRDHNMSGTWGSMRPQMYYRQVTKVDRSANTLTIDIPTRYYLKTRDKARVYKTKSHIQEVGLENFSIGMKQNSKTSFGDNDYNIGGTGSYELHGSDAIFMRHVVNSWVRNVKSYRPPVNTKDIHLASDGIELDYTRNITIENVELGNPQFKGGGGNGYPFRLNASDNLITQSLGFNGRHNYSFTTIIATGNVIHRSEARNGRIPNDFHMHLSVANLFDNFTVDRDFIEARNRWDLGSGHGETTTQSVMWNTNGKAYPPGKQYIVDSDQYKWGLIIGTRGSATKVRTSDSNQFTEFIGTGNNLIPQSLYEDQLKRRTSGTLQPQPTLAPIPTPVTSNAPRPNTPRPVATATPVQQTSGWYELRPVSVKASTHDGNIPENTLDNKLSTRWSAHGNGQWIQYDLGEVKMTKYIKIAFYGGNARKATFDVDTSVDGTQWIKALTKKVSNGTSTQLETFEHPNTPARYVRITGYGNTVNSWNSYTEVKSYGSVL